MELNDYQKQAMMTNAESSNNITYSLFGLFAEVGEIADKIAKAKRRNVISICGDHIYNRTESMRSPEIVELYEGLEKELGDVLWFCAHLASQMGQSLEDIAQTNLAKLADRAKRGVIIGDGDKR